MSVELLDRIRKVNKLLHTSSSNVFVFNDICLALSEAMASNVMVISRKGKILGMGSTNPALVDAAWENAFVGKFIDASLNERLLNILSTKENVHLETLGFAAETNRLYHVIVTPVEIAGERLGSFFIYRREKEYGIDDIIIAEYGAAVIGLEMVRAMDEESAEELRKKQGANLAVGSLSATEIQAVRAIFEEMSRDEGILVASKIADSEGITRSVVVNALRKLESAGAIESRSSGMKGTYIKIRNDLLRDEIRRMTAE